MKSMAARISASDSAGLPALGGIAPLPLITDCTRASVPCLIRGAHSALLPSFGAFATPAVWPAVQVLSETFLPTTAPRLDFVPPTAAGFNAGSLELAPGRVAMNATPRATSASVDEGVPPF